MDLNVELGPDPVNGRQQPAQTHRTPRASDIGDEIDFDLFHKCSPQTHNGIHRDAIISETQVAPLTDEAGSANGLQSTMTAYHPYTGQLSYD
ncbi:hypothetical protein GCM10027565_30710 [Bordetella tumulicola]